MRLRDALMWVITALFLVMVVIGLLYGDPFQVLR